MMPILNFDIILKCACFHLSFWISMFAILFKCVQYRSIIRVLFFSSPHHFLSLIKFVPVDFSAVSLILLTVYFLTRSPCPTEFSLNITHAWFIRFDSFPFHLFILSSANESINPSNLARDDGLVVILSSNTTILNDKNPRFWKHFFRHTVSCNKQAHLTQTHAMTVHVLL